eukprot:GHVU01148904.1.p2 GENE.GHVU01148904.1~~GHVU01148904.1.p2  ORF type:complete len:137 (+),score=9.68 GHVU01148904.1:64-474(+)
MSVVHWRAYPTSCQAIDQSTTDSVIADESSISGRRCRRTHARTHRDALAGAPRHTAMPKTLNRKIRQQQQAYTPPYTHDRKPLRPPFVDNRLDANSHRATQFSLSLYLSLSLSLSVSLSLSLGCSHCSSQLWLLLL